MKQKRKSLLSILLLLFIVAGGGILYTRESAPRESAPREPISRQDFKLNTIIRITIYDSRDETLLDQCMELCDYYEGLFSRTLPSSEIYRLNHGEFSTVSPETAELIETGLAYSRLSDGAFDISIAPVSSLWDFTSDEKKLPDEEELQKALALVDYRKVHVDGNRVTFEEPGMGLDLGAIAKGYIADRLKEYLKDQGVQSALINLGGNVLCLGSRPDGSPFQIGVQKPFGESSETLMVCEISDQSLVSSGTYERCFELNGKWYHHILNPATGYPYDNGLTAVSIRSDSSLVGDALSTTVFALGQEKGLKLLNRLSEAEGIVITEDLTMHASDHF